MSKSDQFLPIFLHKTHLTCDDDDERERKRKRSTKEEEEEEEEEEQKMPPNVMVPKNKEKGIRVRRSSMEKTIFCVLIGL